MRVGLLSSAGTSSCGGINSKDSRGTLKKDMIRELHMGMLFCAIGSLSTRSMSFGFTRNIDSKSNDDTAIQDPIGMMVLLGALRSLEP